MNIMTVFLVLAGLTANLADIRWLTEALLLGAAGLVAVALAPIKVGVKVEKDIQVPGKKYSFQNEFEENLYWLVNPKLEPEEKELRSFRMTKYFVSKGLSKESSVKVVEKTIFNLIIHMENGSLDHIEHAWHKGYDFDHLRKEIKIQVVKL